MKKLFGWFYSLWMAITLVVLSGIVLVLDRTWSPTLALGLVILGVGIGIARLIQLLIEGWREESVSKALGRNLRGQ